MSEKIGIIADSTADFPTGMVEDLGIRYAPIHVFVGGNDYLDGVTISKKEVIDFMKKGHSVRTVPPSPYEYAEIFDDMLNKYDRVISFHVSSQFSDCYKSAKNAISLLYEEQEDRLEIIDTGSVTAGQALIIKKASELLESGVPPGKLYKKLLPFMKNSPICFTVSDLKWLKKGGRIGTLAAMFGTLLNIKPVIGLIKAELKPVGRYRGKKQAVDGMIKKAVEISKQISGGYEIWVSHIDDLDNLNYMRESLSSKLEKNIEDIKMIEIGSTIAAHAGPGCCGWAIMPSL